jgi:hypothetical protein
VNIQLLGDGDDPGRIRAWMYFPSSELLRQQYLMWHQIRRTCKEGDGDLQVSLSASLMLQLIEGPGLKEFKSLTEDAVRQGTVAGDLLNLIFEMYARGWDEPSFGKAIERYKEFGLGGTYKDGSPLKYSEHTLRTCFTNYSAVAHIWAALRLNWGPFPYADDPHEVLVRPDLVAEFLGRARLLGDFATTFVPKRTKSEKPVINPDILVRVPDNFAPICPLFPRFEPVA